MLSPASPINLHLVDILERGGLIPPGAVIQLLERARISEQWVGELALNDGLITENELAEALAREMHLSRIDLANYQPDQHALVMLDRGMCLQHLVLPISRRGGVLHVAVANPYDHMLLNELTSADTQAITISVAPMWQLREAIRAWYESLAEEKAEEPVEGMLSIGIPGGGGRTADALSADAHYVCTLDELLIIVAEQRASDLHLTVGAPPLMRVDGDLRPMAFPKLTRTHIHDMLYPILTREQITEFERTHELDLAYSVPNHARFRVNVFKQRGSIGTIIRSIPHVIPTLDSLNMPPILQDLATRRRGLILVTGPSGAGKSTTVAAIIEEINKSRYAHIMTVEDPIEYLHTHNRCEINQRQIGSDTISFANALRHVMRQDPDIIFIGEMRDLETISIAMTAAETGHLVLSTLHTTSAIQSVDRIIDVFPPYQQEQVRAQLAGVLEGVITQTLLQRSDGQGRACAQEIMVATDAVRNLIREGKNHMIRGIIQASGKQGMQTMDQSLKRLVTQRKISAKDAVLYATNSVDFHALMAME